MFKVLAKPKGDRVIWLTAIVLFIFSILAIYSSTGTLAYKLRSGDTEYYLIQQLVFVVIGILLIYLTHLPNYSYYSRVAQLLLFISVPLLILTFFVGTEINEAKRWISPVGNKTFQPSDIAKLALIMYIARHLSKIQKEKQDFTKTFFYPFVIPILVICGLIMPADLSTAVVLFVTCLLLMFIGRTKIKYLLSLLAVSIVALGLIVMIAFLAPDSGRVSTWKNRIENYTSDNQITYQNQQANIAIATGGFLGKGPGKSIQRNFLPHPYSDFIYAIIIEEYGLLGGLVIILLYLLLLFRSIKIVIKSPKAFGALLASGLSFSLVIQAMANMAVTVNILPVTGLPLPLVSMGGTSLFFSSISIGIILSVSRYIEQTNMEMQDANT